MSYPLVTIGVASFNNARYVAETLDSIKAQTYNRWELIIVDDNSTDNSVEIINSWLAANPTVPARFVQHQANRGVCAVWNKCVQEAQGEYVAIIASDDVYLPHKLATQVRMLQEAAPDTGVVFSDVSKIDPLGNVIVPSVYATGQIYPSEGNIWLPMLRTNFIGAMTTLVRKSAYEAVGPYDESLAYEDWDMWLRLSRICKFVYQPEVTALYRIHGNSAMHKRRANIIETNLRLLQKHVGTSPEGDAVIARHLHEFSEQLYMLDSPDSVKWLRRSWQQHRHARGLALLLAARLGVPAAVVVRTFGAFKRLVGANVASVAAGQ